MKKTSAVLAIIPMVVVFLSLRGNAEGQTVTPGTGLEVTDWKTVRCSFETGDQKITESLLERLRAKLEGRLRQAEITPVAAESREPQVPMLTVYVMQEAGLMEVQYNRLVTYQLEPNVWRHTYAGTWQSTTAYGITGEAQAVAALQELLDEFLDNYLKANKK